MLQGFEIVGGACFGGDPLGITDLKRVNYFYGPNGSGKTTISRAFAGYDSLQFKPDWQDGAEMTIRVYNRDLVDQILLESKRIPGVFVLGENSVDAQTRLNQIEEHGGELDQARDRYERAKSSHDDAKARQADAKESFKDTAWREYRGLVDEHKVLLPAFTGQRGVDKNKEKLVERLLELKEPNDDTRPPELKKLLADADAVFDGGAKARPPLKECSRFRWTDHDGFVLLDQKVVGSSEASLSELVESLGNEDWVQTGRHYLDKTHGRCPFCQQKAPKDLAKQLEDMFDNRYMKQLEKLKRLVNDHSLWIRTNRDAVDGWDEESIRYLDQAAYQKALGSLNAINADNQQRLERKLGAPSGKVEVSVSSDPIDDLNAVIKEANSKIDSHNRLVESQKEEKPKLVAKCWTYLADVLLRDELHEYRRKSADLRKGIDQTQKKIEGALKAIQNLEKEVQDLQHHVKSSEPVIKKINQLLERSGFTSFQIVKSTELTDGYMLARNGVPLDERSLSEGERTFIAFLYYYYSLDASSAKVLAVIDDPISSLDSDILFIVSTLVRNLLEDALLNRGRVAQVIVLTHNVYFHKEVTQLRCGDKGSDRCYYVIRKTYNGPHVVEPYIENPVTTEYERLWSEVRRVSEGEQISIVGLENLLRRILESYFRIAGGIWVTDLTKNLNREERSVVTSLFNWVNVGSHGIFENLHYSPGETTRETYLDVFKHVFEIAGHSAHYEMMMRIGSD